MISDLAIVPVKKKLCMDPNSKALPFISWLEQSYTSPYVKGLARLNFGIMTQGGYFIPYVDYIPQGIMLTWDNSNPEWRRIIYVALTTGNLIRWQITNRPVLEDKFDWRTCPPTIQPTDLFNRIIDNVSETCREAI